MTAPYEQSEITYTVKKKPHVAQARRSAMWLCKGTYKTLLLNMVSQVNDF